jgi:predicted phosphoribosyltransferase
MGAIASGDIVVLNSFMLKQLDMPPEILEAVCRREEQELVRREELYRRGRPSCEIEGKDVIVVDDGLATGASMRAAVLAIRKQSPRRLTVAVPVSSEEAYLGIKNRIDEIVCVSKPDPFIAVGAWFEDFSQTSDEEVQDLLAAAAKKWKAA